jgi:2-dehydro-3-deoxygalactonokinase
MGRRDCALSRAGWIVTSNEPAMICVDWGTSSFRAYLTGVDGTIHARTESPRGILTVGQGEHEEALASFIGKWLTQGPLPILMSGMIGARQGWAEAPYAQCPAGLQEIAAAIVTLETRTLGAIGLVPGVSTFGRDGSPDVMRGEETQILGALAAMAIDQGVFVLPGTHSKWARVEGGRIVSFATYMTGELFAALKDHTILGRLMAAAESGGGFAEGVRAAFRLERPGDVLHAIFMTRTLGLFDRLAPGQLSDYLSGLLIGAELLSGAQGAAEAVVIGSPALTARYCTAGEILGLALQPAPEDCAPLGQLALLPYWRTG